MSTNRPTSIAAYIAAAPVHAQPLLQELYLLLRRMVPDAKEAVKWNSAVFEEGRILFAFSAHRKHINFVPTLASLEPFRKELEGHTVGRISLQLPYDKPLPSALIRKIALHRVKDVRWM